MTDQFSSKQEQKWLHQDQKQTPQSFATDIAELFLADPYSADWDLTFLGLGNVFIVSLRDGRCFELTVKEVPPPTES